MNTEINFMFALKIQGGDKNKKENQNQSLVWKQTALVLFLRPECKYRNKCKEEGKI